MDLKLICFRTLFFHHVDELVEVNRSISISVNLHHKFQHLAKISRSDNNKVPSGEQSKGFAGKVGISDRPGVREAPFEMCCFHVSIALHTAQEGPLG